MTNGGDRRRWRGPGPLALLGRMLGSRRADGDARRSTARRRALAFARAAAWAQLHRW
ncbi:hypothetical protein ACFOW4_00815 [Micromonospora sp. GCM10011542]|uniref:hypothetical protein n=1 Tax=Micromonospora sp. GCM10011542 TaxID=3317337 RepID=UPI00360F01AD